jgi:hypothetical protein
MISGSLWANSLAESMGGRASGGRIGAQVPDEEHVQG